MAYPWPRVFTIDLDDLEDADLDVEGTRDNAASAALARGSASHNYDALVRQLDIPDELDVTLMSYLLDLDAPASGQSISPIAVDERDVELTNLPVESAWAWLTR